VLLAVLTVQEHRVDVASFGDVGPGASASVPDRMAEVVVPAPSGSSAAKAYLTSVVHFLRAQEAPFQARTQVLHLPGRQTILLIRFGAPSPLGLLGARTSP
jgi:hypothetical protein